MVQYDGSLEALCHYVDCDTVDLIRLDREHVMFVDDMGLYRDYKFGFSVAIGNRKPVEIVGSALITGEKLGEPAGLNFDFRDIHIELICYGERKETKEEEGV
jgi:hypothetical protein